MKDHIIQCDELIQAVELCLHEAGTEPYQDIGSKLRLLIRRELTQRDLKMLHAKIVTFRKAKESITRSELVSLLRLTSIYSYARNPASNRPPLNAEYVLYLLLRNGEREAVIGDLVECYGQILRRFNKRRADVWFYKQVIGSLWPLLRRALLRIGALVWLSRILRRLIS